MNFGNMLIIVFLTYYTIYFLSLFRLKNRKMIQIINIEMDKLRKVPIKSVEEQKQFINLKFPKKQKTKFRWSIVPKFLYNIVKFICIIQLYIFIFYYLNINLLLWQSILIVIVAPIMINFILEKFNLHKSDLKQFLRW